MDWLARLPALCPCASTQCRCRSFRVDLRATFHALRGRGRDQPDADLGCTVHVVMAGLIRTRREQTCEIDSASLMLTSGQWIPLEGVFELPLIEALV
jgi:hypothetical protein